MIKPIIFAHRGAMGYCIENTIPAFKKAIEMGADGLETDIRFTKDKKMICFHNTGFEVNEKWNKITKLTLEQIKNIKFQDNREIPTIEEVFNLFKDSKNNLQFSCDIENKKVGVELMNLANNYSILKKLVITDMRLRVLSYLREQNRNVNLIHTIPHNIVKINNNTVNFDKLKNLNINIINIKNENATPDHFKIIIDNGFKVYVWGVNQKFRMKKVLKLKFKDEIVEALYTDYPDVLIKLRNELYR